MSTKSEVIFGEKDYSIGVRYDVYIFSAFI